MILRVFGEVVATFVSVCVVSMVWNWVAVAYPGHIVPVTLKQAVWLFVVASVIGVLRMKRKDGNGDGLRGSDSEE